MYVRAENLGHAEVPVGTGQEADEDHDVYVLIEGVVVVHLTLDRPSLDESPILVDDSPCSFCIGAVPIFSHHAEQGDEDDLKDSREADKLSAVGEHIIFC